MKDWLILGAIVTLLAAIILLNHTNRVQTERINELIDHVDKELKAQTYLDSVFLDWHQKEINQIKFLSQTTLKLARQ